MAKKLKKILKSFTLIELIIVIAIIAVLGATAFLLLTQWMSKGRDAQRISDLNVIQNALSIQITKEDGLPLPDEKNVLMTGTINILYQGKFGSGVISKMNTLTKVPMDRQYGEYDYSLLGDRVTYKVQAIMENEQNKTAYMNRVFANDMYYRYVGKDVKGIIVGDDFVYLPNMFLTGYVNGEQQLGDAVNNFLRNKVGEYVTGGIVLYNNNQDGIIAMMTGLGLSTNEATSIFSKATGVSASTSGTTEPSLPEDASWCYYSSNELSDAHADWNSTELKYDSANNKCYVFGDEDDNAKAACNKWVADNATLGGEFVWVPARWFVDDGTTGGMSMKNIFYQREVNYNGNDYGCRGFAIAKYEMTYKDLSHNPDNNGRNTYGYHVYTNTKGGFVSKQGYPIATINQLQAINACRSVGSNYHLITNIEWMTASRNIEQNGNNWTTGIKGSGGLFRGISDESNFGCPGRPDGQRAVSSTNSSCTRRIHTISNNNQIRDMSGNVWEHVDRGNNPHTLIVNVGNGNMCGTTNYWYINGDPSTSCAINNGPLNNKGGLDKGMGYLRKSDGIDKIFYRGGSSSAGSISGIYSNLMFRTSTSSDHHVGFRCVR
ncbi:MAG: SUMF1/EgtB/PvdO family nonheme iron enzyme [Candidatus Absconditabacteria bacterium]